MESPHIGNPGEREKVTTEMRSRVLRRDNGTCRYCGRYRPAGEMHIDHVYPVKFGGRSTFKNLVVACPSCNQSKGTKAWTPLPCGSHLTLDPDAGVTITDNERAVLAARLGDAPTRAFRDFRGSQRVAAMTAEDRRRINGC